MVNAQVPVPLQTSPDQRVKREPQLGLGVIVTLVPGAKPSAHPPGQSIPSGSEVSRPVPAPSDETVRTKVPGAGRGPADSNFARSSRSASSCTSHAPLPEHAPVQPLNDAPVDGTASR